ncbi:MAG: aminopeptidase [Chloroflexota bacterium]
MSLNFEQGLRRYADLAIRVGLNLKAGQRLIITDARRGGVPLETAPLVRELVASAYQAGARLVDVTWRDDQVLRARYLHAPRDSFEEFPDWKARGLLEHVQRGDALLTILAANPDLLNDQDPDLVSTVTRVAWQHHKPVYDLTGRNAVNWLVISASYPGWAAKVFPDIPPSEQVDHLWQALFNVCRVDRPDPLAAWQEHIRQLVARSDILNARQYDALHITGPGTDLTVGLPAGHRWMSARTHAQNGIDFTANIPTEEVFTLPHRLRVDGSVASTRPLNYGDTLIEGIHLTFHQGRVVEARAKKGEAVLKGLIATDEGSARLGEIALVPDSSPISQSGLMFFNTLLDENCASHVALGDAYKFCLQGGEALSDEAFAQAGGNPSLVHVDFMIGSAEVDIDGLTADGRSEPLMRSGEWAFTV